ncbi:LysR family transcriptional regulator [Pseudohoeflea coraliihabitans]|uniref:LysR family transcriptional regulator n=1 Tax=Pseudohoeflea coraliihabitans TaxID=2860393 RepID=A0ABS6WPT2_9HYPH|nr:LysR family transcriptional regulator [Pseudohoeflea sp. DP4N28-3]MBW3097079.1 LysR family transcriptional regulator [Pseudohoeflea sp. DP4N28-3]
MAFDWDDIRVFLAVARAGQILAASRRLKLNHATTARRISALESALDSQLLIRRTNGCVLTEAGEALLAHAERMEAEMLAAQGSLGRTDSTIAGTVRIGAPDGFGVSFLAKRLGALTARHPDLKLQLVPVPRSFSLPQREADIAITVEQPAMGRLVSRKLLDYSLSLYASKSYLEEMGRPKSADDLRAHRLISYVEDLIFSPSLHFTREILRNWSAHFEISSAIGQVEAVRSGAGIAVLHDFIAPDHPELERVLPDYRIERSYYMVYHEAARELARLRTVADFITEAAAAERLRFLPSGPKGGLQK